MDCTPTYLPCEQTGYFSKIIIDYLKEDERLKPFYEHPVSLDGIRAAIKKRKNFPPDRKLLVEQLQLQYAGMTLEKNLASNIERLNNENSFTVTTAHQPNIFTGPLYFVYKILHTVRLANWLTEQIPAYHFVPVFYMGSEDADLDELGHIFLSGEKYEWKTDQTGAFGRMKVDKELIRLISAISGQLLVLPFGEEIISLVKTCYREGDTIEKATFKFIHALFGEYGLVILLPDNRELKRSFIPVMEKELTASFSYKAVEATVNAFPKTYKVQAGGRQINLFYLLEGKRERIAEVISGRKTQSAMVSRQFKVNNSNITFNGEELLNELHANPEHFSPNVILRPVYQEMILPNIAFIGGGGEIAYWLELKKLFAEAVVPFPVLVLRNSFLVVDKDQEFTFAGLGFSVSDLFRMPDVLLNELIKRDSTVQLSLDNEIQSLAALYARIKNVAAGADTTLQRHVEALHVKALNKVEVLQKKMSKAQKIKFEAQQRKLHKLRSQLFPNNNLQERVENLLPFYARWGKDFIHAVLDHSKGLEAEFGILKVQG